MSEDFKQSHESPLIGSGQVRLVRMPDFLPTHERDALYQAVCTNQQAFHSPGDSEAGKGGTYFLSLEGEGIGPVKAAGEFLSRRILKQLPELFAALGVEPFDVAAIPWTLINGLDGHSGLPHADSYDDRYKISLLYYFHRTPKAFCGGELQLYETDAATATGHSEAPVARIDQEDNLLIAFLSQTFHGITDVRCDSEDFADGRFVAVAFLGPQ